MNKNTYAKRASLGAHGVEHIAAKKSRKWFAGVAAVALAGLLVVGGTIAWLVSSTGTVTNTFVVGGVTTDIVEEFDDDTKENVYVKNTNNVPVYVRAQVVINWIDVSNNNIVASVPSDYTYVMDPATLPAGSGWVKGGDGFYYYTKPLAANDEAETDTYKKMTSNLINKVESFYPESPKYRLSVEVLTEAVQAVPKTAVEDAWDASVADQGTATVADDVLTPASDGQDTEN